MLRHFLLFSNILIAILFFAMTVDFVRKNEKTPAIILAAILTIVEIANVFYIGF